MIGDQIKRFEVLAAECKRRGCRLDGHWSDDHRSWIVRHYTGRDRSNSGYSQTSFDAYDLLVIPEIEARLDEEHASGVYGRCLFLAEVVEA